MSKQKTDLEVFQEWVQELKELVFGTPITDLMEKPSEWKEPKQHDFSYPITEYWKKRIDGKHYTHIKFQLAYSKNPPTMLVEVLGKNIVDYKGVKSYAFDLGKIIEVNNYE